MRSNAADLGGEPGFIGIGGESVGGTMAVATALQLAGAGDPVAAAVVARYPLTTGEQYGESMVDAPDARPLSRPLLSWMAMHAFGAAAVLDKAEAAQNEVARHFERAFARQLA